MSWVHVARLMERIEEVPQASRRVGESASWRAPGMTCARDGKVVPREEMGLLFCGLG